MAPQAQTSLEDVDATLKIYQFLVDSIPLWIVAINSVLDGTPQRIAPEDQNSRSSSQATPGLSAKEDTTVEFSSIEPESSALHHQQYLPTPQQHAALHPSRHSLHKRKRSASPTPSERSVKQNKYRLRNSIRIMYDGEAQHNLESIVKGADKGAYEMRKRCDEARRLQMAKQVVDERESVLASLKTCVDNCYSAAVQLLKDGMCEAQLNPAKSALERAKTIATAQIQSASQSIVAQTTKLKIDVVNEPVAPLAAKPLLDSVALDVDVDDDEEDDDDDFVMSKIGHRLTSRMAKT